MQRKLGQSKDTGKREVAGVGGGAVGAACGGPTSPSFLVRNMNNVNAQPWEARVLLTMWDFLEYKGRIGTTNIIVQRKDAPSVLRIMAASARSRYFEPGRLHMSSRIKQRLGRFQRVPGLMETLTYDIKKISKQGAWESFGKDVRQFINGVNEYRKRRGWRRLHYLWVVEVQEGTGYPHVHIFFPNLKWLAPLNIISGNWTKGRANIESPKKITTNCAAYVSKYLRKMRGWSDIHLALLWTGRCRMYGFSRGFSAKLEKKESEWQKWHIIQTNDTAQLEKGLEEGGYVIEHLGVDNGGRTSN